MKMSALACRLVTATIAATLLMMAQPGFGEGVKYKPISVKTPDGLTISAQEWGNPAGPEILFIHGFSQSHLSWMRQVEGDLAKEFHIVTYDLRGHGNSDKPLDPARYRDSKAWGDEVQAVIDAAGLKRPVLVGWSYAGRVISDYLATHGAGQIRGHQLRRCVDQGRSCADRRQPEEPAPDDVGGSHDQHFSDRGISCMAASPNSPAPTTTRPCWRST